MPELRRPETLVEAGQDRVAILAIAGQDLEPLARSELDQGRYEEPVEEIFVAAPLRTFCRNCRA